VFGKLREARAYLRQVPASLGREKNTESAQRTKSEGPRRLASPTFVQQNALGVPLDGQTDSLALPQTQCELQQPRPDWLAKGSLPNPVRKGHNRLAFCSHCRWNEDIAEQQLQERQPLDLVQGDQGAGV